MKSRIAGLYPWIVFGFLTKSLLGQCGTESSKIVPMDTAGSFGYSVAVRGDQAIVGSKYDDDHPCGSAHIFSFDGSNWVEEQEIFPEDMDCEQFGDLNGVGIDGDVAIVTSQLSTTWFWEYGAVYVFRKVESAWVQETKLMAGDIGCFDGSYPVPAAIEQDTIVLGEWWSSTAAAEVFRYDGSTWNVEQILVPSGPDMGYYAGFSVAMSGDVIMVGAFDDGENGNSSGAVYVFRRKGTTWVEEQKLTPLDADAGDFFGWGVSLRGDLALLNGPADQNWHGAAYVFRYDGISWLEEQKLKPAANEYFTLSVAIDDSLALAGRHLFVYDGMSWTEHTELTGTIDTFAPLSLDENSAFLGEVNNKSVMVFDVSCLRPCGGDVNGDGLVDPLDSGQVLANFGCAVGAGDQECDAADANADGIVDPLDVGFILSRFGECP